MLMRFLLDLPQCLIKIGDRFNHLNIYCPFQDKKQLPYAILQPIG